MTYIVIRYADIITISGGDGDDVTPPIIGGDVNTELPFVPKT